MKKTIAAILSAFLFSLPVHAQTVPQDVRQMQLSFAPLVKKAAPAVVYIYTKRVVRERTQIISPFFSDPFFNRFFGAPSFAGPERERVERSLGSGVIVDGQKGIVVTNSHVIRNATEITVATAEGVEYPAEKVLDDEKTDLAVLRIDTRGHALPALEMTDSDALEVGDIVLAIGNPFGVGQTVTSGIVSGLARTQTSIADYGFFIQTDAAINPGNSGGALIDMQGRLIGINTAIFSRDGGSLGIGFAIPANMVRMVVNAAQNGGRFITPWTGVTSQDVTPDLLEGLGLSRAYGTLVTKVARDGPADEAGLKPGDVILSVNGHEIQNAHALRFRLATVPLGTTVQLKVWRNGKEVVLPLTTAAPPEIPPRDTWRVEGASPLAGAQVMNVSPAVRQEIEDIAVDKGVVISDPGEGAAAGLGLRRGDVVLSVNGAQTGSVKELKKAVKKNARSWTVQILRGNRLVNLTLAG